MRLPAGTRDWLAPELRRKRAVEAAMRGVFERWAYEEVQTPSFERLDALAMGLGTNFVDESFLFTDRDGTQLALRPEMTTPVARLVSTRMRGANLPMRLSYVQPAFVYQDVQEGKLREFTQAGLELIGEDSLDADAESLFTALEALDSLGLGDAHVDINHAAIIDGVLAGLELDEGGIASAKRLISGRNIVALRERLNGSGDRADIDALIQLSLWRGRDDVLAAARKRCHTDAGLAGIERLQKLIERANGLDYLDRINVDLSLLRDITYYTGLIFEGFAGEVGFALCGGGRYDGLLPKFGFEAGAVGWSTSVERLLIALERRQSPNFGEAPAIDVLVSGSDVVAARERAAGRIVRLDFDNKNELALIEEAKSLRIPRILIAQGAGVREIVVA